MFPEIWKMLNAKLLIVLILVSVDKLVTSLKCHVCNSQLSTSCVDPFNKSETLQVCDERISGGRFGGDGRLLDVVDIIMQAGDDGVASQSPQQSATQKVVQREMVCQKIVVLVGNESITGRGCSPLTVDGMHPCDAVRLSAPGNVRHCVTCPTDACNAARGVRLTPALVVGTVVGVFTRGFREGKVG